MGLNYSIKTIRSSAILTNSYVAATVIGPRGIVGTSTDPVDNNQFNLYIAFTLGDLTSVSLKIEFSDDGSTYYQETAGSISGGTSTDSLLEHTYTVSGNYRIPLEIADRYIKVSVKGVGTVTSSLMALDAILAIRP